MTQNNAAENADVVLSDLEARAFQVLYDRVFDNRAPNDPWRMRVEAEYKRRADAQPEDQFQLNFQAEVHQ